MVVVSTVVVVVPDKLMVCELTATHNGKVVLVVTLVLAKKTNVPDWKMVVKVEMVLMVTGTVVVVITLVTVEPGNGSVLVDVKDTV